MPPPWMQGPGWAKTLFMESLAASGAVILKNGGVNGSWLGASTVFAASLVSGWVRHHLAEHILTSLSSPTFFPP